MKAIVIDKSKNVNSFGYRGYRILIQKDSRIFVKEGLRQAYGSDPELEIGDWVEPDSAFVNHITPVVEVATGTIHCKFACGTFTTSGFILGRVGIHKSLKSPRKWTVTVLDYGVAAVHAESPLKAVEAYLQVADKVSETAKRQGFVALTEAEKDSATPWTAPAEKSEKPNIHEVAAAIAKVAGLNAAETAAVHAALSKKTGRLKAKAPADDLVKAAWNGLQPNPFKIQLSACFLRGDAKELVHKLAAKSWPVWLDSDAKALVDLGVW